MAPTLKFIYEGAEVKFPDKDGNEQDLVDIIEDSSSYVTEGQLAAVRAYKEHEAALAAKKEEESRWS